MCDTVQPTQPWFNPTPIHPNLKGEKVSYVCVCVSGVLCWLFVSAFGAAFACLDLRLSLCLFLRLPDRLCLALRFSQTFRGKKDKRWPVSLAELDSETQIDSSISV